MKVKSVYWKIRDKLGGLEILEFAEDFKVCMIPPSCNNSDGVALVMKPTNR